MAFECGASRRGLDLNYQHDDDDEHGLMQRSNKNQVGIMYQVSPSFAKQEKRRKRKEG